MSITRECSQFRQLVRKRRAARLPAEPSAPVPNGLGRALPYPADAYATYLPAETVEFSVTDAAKKCVPFVRRELKNCTCGVPAVTDADPAVGQARYLDAVTVGKTQRALDPSKTRIGSYRRVSVHRYTHVVYLTDCYENPGARLRDVALSSLIAIVNSKANRQHRHLGSRLPQINTKVR
jgi:hypothetical protein